MNGDVREVYGGGNVITALKRLERAGSEDSRTTEKLKTAVYRVGCYVLAQMDASTLDVVSSNNRGPESLPRGYLAGERWDGNRYWPVLETWDQESQRPVRVDATRATALQFAADIASGWLDELAAWLEARDATRATALQFAADIASGRLDELAAWLEARAAEAAKAAAVLEEKV